MIKKYFAKNDGSILQHSALASLNTCAFFVIYKKIHHDTQGNC